MDSTRKMTVFTRGRFLIFQGVGAFGALRGSRAALARHLHRQAERGSINLLRKREAARNISLEAGTYGELISVINAN